MWDAMTIFKNLGMEADWLTPTSYYETPASSKDVVELFRKSTKAGNVIFAHADFYWQSQDRWIGHYFLITSVDEDGNIYIMDPYFGYKRPVPLNQTGLNPRYKGAFAIKKQKE